MILVSYLAFNILQIKLHAINFLSIIKQILV